MPSLGCCPVMKRKSNGVGVEEEEGQKKTKMENGSEDKEPLQAKCPICLWPSGAPECYHQGGGGLGEEEAS